MRTPLTWAYPRIARSIHPFWKIKTRPRIPVGVVLVRRGNRNYAYEPAMALD